MDLSKIVSGGFCFSFIHTWWFLACLVCVCVCVSRSKECCCAHTRGAVSANTGRQGLVLLLSWSVLFCFVLGVFLSLIQTRMWEVLSLVVVVVVVVVEMKKMKMKRRL